MAEKQKAKDIILEEMPYAIKEGPLNRERALSIVQEKDPEGLASLQESNTEDKSDWLNIAQYYTDDYVDQSPAPIQKLDKFLLENAAYSINVPFGTEDSSTIEMKSRMGYGTELLRGLKSGKRSSEDLMVDLPGENKNPFVVMHESAHAENPEDQPRGFLEQLTKTFDDTLLSLGQPVGKSGKPMEEAAVTSLDLYRALHRKDPSRIASAIEYLNNQYNKRTMSRREDVPDFSTPEGLEELANNAVAYTLSVVDQNNLYSEKEKNELASDIKNSFKANEDIIFGLTNAYRHYDKTGDFSKVDLYTNALEEQYYSPSKMSNGGLMSADDLSRELDPFDAVSETTVRFIDPNAQVMDERLEALFRGYFNGDYSRDDYANAVRKVQEFDPETFNNYFLGPNTDERIKLLNYEAFSDNPLPHMQEESDDIPYALTIPFGAERDSSLGGSRRLKGTVIRSSLDADPAEEIFVSGTGTPEQSFVARHEMRHLKHDRAGSTIRGADEEERVRAFDALHAVLLQDEDAIKTIFDLEYGSKFKKDKENFPQYKEWFDTKFKNRVQSAIQMLPYLYKQGLFDDSKADKELVKQFLEDYDKNEQGFVSSLLGSDPEKQENVSTKINTSTTDAKKLAKILALAPFVEKAGMSESGNQAKVRYTVDREATGMNAGGLMSADETYVEDGSPDVKGDLPFTGEDIVRTVAELAPVTGEILSAKEAVKDYEEGNYGMAALGALGALPGVGIIGRGAKKAVKTAINVRKDAKAGVDYAEEIISGNKKYETRDTPSLNSYVGKRIGIAKTGDGEAKAIGSVEIGEPIVVDEKQFREMQELHLVPEGSAFDIKPGGKKYLYPVSNPERFDTPKSVGRGIVSRKIIDDVPVGKLDVEDAEFKKLQSAWKERTGKGENKEVSRRFEEMTEAAQAVQNGELSVAEFRKIADSTKPVTQWDFVPEPATYEDMFFALDSRKRTKPFLGYDIELEDGVRTTSRLDIPAYTENDVWVVTLKGGKDAADGQTIYSPAVRMKDVDLSQSVPLQMKSLKIAAGGGKGPHAVMSGAYVKESVEDTHKLAQEALNSKEWIQVGYDPTRRGYFYDRKTMEPVLYGDDMVQVGPLVLVKNAKKGKPEDFEFNAGGLMSDDYNRAMA